MVGWCGMGERERGDRERENDRENDGGERQTKWTGNEQSRAVICPNSLKSLSVMEDTTHPCGCGM